MVCLRVDFGVIYPGIINPEQTATDPRHDACFELLFEKQAMAQAQKIQKENQNNSAAQAAAAEQCKQESCVAMAVPWRVLLTLNMIITPPFTITVMSRLSDKVQQKSIVRLMDERWRERGGKGAWLCENAIQIP